MKQLDFPDLRQTYEYDCGAKSLQAVLVYYGIEVREELLMKAAKTSIKEGTFTHELCHAIEKYGLKTEAREMTLEEVKDFIDRKIPVILALQAWGKKSADYSHDYHDGHWVVAIGYDKNRLLFEDPYSFQHTFLSKKELEERWHSKEHSKKSMHLGVAVYGKKPTYHSGKMLHMD